MHPGWYLQWSPSVYKPLMIVFVSVGVSLV